MKYQETGRFGRITKNLRKLGFEKEMEEILFDSSAFPGLKKTEQNKYLETVVKRMKNIIGSENTDYCSCSVGHMAEFFSTIFEIKNIELLNSIYAGDDRCKWLISIKEKDNKKDGKI